MIEYQAKQAMDLQKWLLVFLSLCSIPLLALAQPDLLFSSCGQSETYTQGSTYLNNLKQILSSLPSKINEHGFYNGSTGENPDRVSVVGLCRGDVEQPNMCGFCFDCLARKLLESCPTQKEGFGGYDECMIYYSNNESIISPGSWSRFPMFYLWNTQNASSPELFQKDLSKLLEGLRDLAANDSSKYAGNHTGGPDFQTIFAAVQCSPVLDAQICFDCLTSAFKDYAGCEQCKGKKGGRVVRPSCNFRFETERFYTTTGTTRALEVEPPKPEIEFSPPPPGNNDNTVRTIIIIVTVVGAVFIFTICVYIALRKRQKRKLMNGLYDAESLQYDFDTIRTATNNFSDSNKLGQGGFGPVYKGKLPNEQEVAVKRLSSNSGQGELEFKNEVLLVAKLQHRNLVRLLGFCLKGRERLLVYEFVPNASLDHILFDQVKSAHLDWETRYKIISGISKGLLYLHEDSRLRIIHRDLKASNILLDSEMNPKISDFGMARLIALGETEGSTNRIVGTFGYMAPEYIMHGQFSIKSDVFSFGVLVLEIISGQKNTRSQNQESVQDLLSYAWIHWREGTTSDLIDPIMLRVESAASMPKMMRFIHIALLCVQENVADRPTMPTVVLMLNGSYPSLPAPSRPAFFMRGTFSLECPNPSYSSQNESSFITELYPR